VLRETFCMTLLENAASRAPFLFVPGDGGTSRGRANGPGAWQLPFHGVASGVDAGTLIIPGAAEHGERVFVG
jgi:hypothetical protein